MPCFSSRRPWTGQSWTVSGRWPGDFFRKDSPFTGDAALPREKKKTHTTFCRLDFQGICICDWGEPQERENNFERNDQCQVVEHFDIAFICFSWHFDIFWIILKLNGNSRLSILRISTRLTSDFLLNVVFECWLTHGRFLALSSNLIRCQTFVLTCCCGGHMSTFWHRISHLTVDHTFWHWKKRVTGSLAIAWVLTHLPKNDFC